MNEILKNIKNNYVIGLQVFEDNGGGLGLAIWYSEKEEDFFCHWGYEYTPGMLIENLKDLQTDSPYRWENMKEMPRQEWFEMINNPFAGRVILDLDGLVAPEHMGAAGKTEFEDYLI